MEITREKHLSYITKLMPLLLMASILQTFIYMKWVPNSMAIDICIFLIIGVVCIAASFALYGQLHKVKLHSHHLEFGFFNYKEEILYKHIQHIEVEVSRHAFYNATLILRDGRVYTLYYLDDVQDLKQLVKSA